MTARIVRWRRFAAAILSALIAGAGLAVTGTPAQAATCSESRATAEKLAASGAFWERRERMELVALSIRVAPSAGCTWGLLADLIPYAMTGWVWIDRSRDGGATWVKSDVRKVSGKSSSYTSAYGTAGYNAVRACGQYMRQNIGTPRYWWDPQGASKPPTMSSIYCTAWVTP